MVDAELFKVSNVLLNITKCSDCVFNQTCENLIDNYKDSICQVLENEMEVREDAEV